MTTLPKTRWRSPLRLTHVIFWMFSLNVGGLQLRILFGPREQTRSESVELHICVLKALIRSTFLGLVIQHYVDLLTSTQTLNRWGFVASFQMMQTLQNKRLWPTAKIRSALLWPRVAHFYRRRQSDQHVKVFWLLAWIYYIVSTPDATATSSVAKVLIIMGSNVSCHVTFEEDKVLALRIN